jgi:hypothetical protein
MHRLHGCFVDLASLTCPVLLQDALLSEDQGEDHIDFNDDGTDLLHGDEAQEADEEYQVEDGVNDGNDADYADYDEAALLEDDQVNACAWLCHHDEGHWCGSHVGYPALLEPSSHNLFGTSSRSGTSTHHVLTPRCQ